MSQDVPLVQVDHAILAHASTKGSCPTPSSATTVAVVAAGNPFEGEPQDDQCELLIDGSPPRVMAIGRVYKGSSTIRHVPLTDD